MSQAILYISKINIPSDRLPIILLTAKDRNKELGGDILDNLPEKTNSPIIEWVISNEIKQYKYQD